MNINSLYNVSINVGGDREVRSGGKVSYALSPD
jgi:hypothetical protein